MTQANLAEKTASTNNQPGQYDYEPDVRDTVR